MWADIVILARALVANLTKVLQSPEQYQSEPADLLPILAAHYAKHKTIFACVGSDNWEPAALDAVLAAGMFVVQPDGAGFKVRAPATLIPARADI